METHGIVLFYIVANLEATMREMSNVLELTERRITEVVHDLADSEFVTIKKKGRQNVYYVNPDARFPHPTLSHVSLGQFIEILQERG